MITEEDIALVCINTGFHPYWYVVIKKDNLDGLLDEARDMHSVDEVIKYLEGQGLQFLWPARHYVCISS